MNIQLSIFDILDQTPLNDKIAKIINCETTEIRLLNAIALSVKNFQALPKEQQYILSFSGGKDSHVLLAIYHLYLKLGNEPLDLIVRFADTELEHKSLYESVNLTQKYCDWLCHRPKGDRVQIPFEIVKGKHSYWYIQFAWGYPVPSHFVRWCTNNLKVAPMSLSRKLKAITGRHLGGSKARDQRLKSCGSDTCSTDKIQDKYDPLLHWTNCLIWDAIYYFDGNLLYKNCFNILKAQYEQAEDDKTGSLRLGCFMCPVISLKTLQDNFESGLIDEKAIAVRNLLEELREARRIKNPRTEKNGAIYIEDRRKYWRILDKQYLINQGYLKIKDWEIIDKALKSDYSYPKTYTKKWIDKQHELIKTNEL